MTTLEKVRAKVIEAVPEKFAREYIDSETGVKQYRHQRSSTPEIQLADVLRVIPELWAQPKTDKADNSFRYITNGIFSTGIKWNLALSLDDQEPAVIEFIGKVLGV